MTISTPWTGWLGLEISACCHANYHVRTFTCSLIYAGAGASTMRSRCLPPKTPSENVEKTPAFVAQRVSPSPALCTASRSAQGPTVLALAGKSSVPDPAPFLLRLRLVVIVRRRPSPRGLRPAARSSPRSRPRRVDRAGGRGKRNDPGGGGSRADHRPERGGQGAEAAHVLERLVGTISPWR